MMADGRRGFDGGRSVVGRVWRIRVRGLMDGPRGDTFRDERTSMSAHEGVFVGSLSNWALGFRTAS